MFNRSGGDAQHKCQHCSTHLRLGGQEFKITRAFSDILSDIVFGMSKASRPL